MTSKQLGISIFFWIWSVVLIGYTVRCIRAGRIQVNRKYILRNKAPGAFWYTIGYNLLIAIITALIPFLPRVYNH